MFWVANRSAGGDDKVETEVLRRALERLREGRPEPQGFVRLLIVIWSDLDWSSLHGKAPQRS